MQTFTHFLRKITGGQGLSTPLAIIIGAIILGTSHIVYGLVVTRAPQAATQLFKGRPIDANDYVTGNTNSNVLLVEYSDTECPYCAQLYPTIAKIKEEYASSVGFVYRYFPLTQIHPHSFEEARAVYCVGKSVGTKKRDEYINSIFTYKIGKKNMVLPDGGKEALAKNVGVDDKTFTACMASQESENVVGTSINDGIAAGVQGTPSTFILVKRKSGYEVVAQADGARPYEYFKSVLDDALGR